MKTKLVEVFQIGSERGGILDVPEKYWPDPGQYLPCQRVALFPYKVSPIWLLTLVRKALSQNASISLFTESIPSAEIMSRLPSVVEVNQVSTLLENLDWPDFLAVDVSRYDLEEFSGLFSQDSPNLNGQVLVRTPMPCRGLGECGVCSVKTTRGWKYACIDGPVFSLKEVLHVAQ